MRLHPSEIILGFQKGLKEALKILEKSVVEELKDIKDKKSVSRAMKATISSKQYGNEEFLTDIISEACINVCPEDPLKFNVDNVRTEKIPGGNLTDSYIIKGFVLNKEPEGQVKHVKDAKVAIFTCNIDISSLDTKETILIESKQELLDYSKTEETEIENEIKEIASAGINVIVSGGSFGDMAMHYIEKYNMMAVKVQSKFEMRRLCKSIKAVPFVRIVRFKNKKRENQQKMESVNQ
jgi:T-complex protein 1 subunit theta